jgi:hypothetical protein
LLPQGGEPVPCAAQLGLGARRVQAGRRPEREDQAPPREPPLGPRDRDVELGEVRLSASARTAWDMGALSSHDSTLNVRPPRRFAGERSR